MLTFLFFFRARKLSGARRGLGKEWGEVEAFCFFSFVFFSFVLSSASVTFYATKLHCSALESHHVCFFTGMI